MSLRKGKELKLIIGPPGSGKTFLSQKYDGFIIFDNDKIIKTIYGILKFYPQIKSIAKTMTMIGVEETLKKGLSVIVTISGRTTKERKTFIDMARRYEYHTTIIVMRTDKNVCIHRCLNDNNRPKTTTWEPIINRWFRVYQDVTNEECDTIIEIAQ